MDKMRISTYKIFGILIGIALLVIIVFFTYTRINNAGKIGVKIDVFPGDAKISIDGKQVRKGKIYLTPGDHSVVATRKYFKDYTRTITVGSIVSSYAFILDATTSEGKKWVDTHQNEYSQIRKLNEESIQEYGEAFRKKNPIAAKLPYKTFMYQIGYINDNSDPSNMSIIVTIYANEAYRQAALYRIYQLGFDPTDLNIVFKDYENPFPL